LVQRHFGVELSKARKGKRAAAVAQFQVWNTRSTTRVTSYLWPKNLAPNCNRSVASIGSSNRVSAPSSNLSSIAFGTPRRRGVSPERENCEVARPPSCAHSGSGVKPKHRRRIGRRSTFCKTRNCCALRKVLLRGRAWTTGTSFLGVARRSARRPSGPCNLRKRNGP
jgi:hypothetical protein